MLVNERGIYRACFADLLAAFRPGHDWRPAFDEGLEYGFNGRRVFAGDLTWNGQTCELALEHLPGLLEYGKERGSYFLVDACTDTGVANRSRDYVERHLQEVARICLAAGNALVTGANEFQPVHGTQRSDIVDICMAFKAEAEAMGLLYCPGSVHGGDPCNARALWSDHQRRAFDEAMARYEAAKARGEDVTPPGPPYWDEISHFHGTFGASHLQDRDDVYDGERRARELEHSSNDRNVPWFGDEQRAAGEVHHRPRRVTEPGLFFAQGANARAFEIHRVFHCEDWLWARPLSGPAQKECARAFVKGFDLAPRDCPRMAFRSAHWDSSPVSINLDDERLRGTSALNGADDFVLVLGITSDPQLQGRHGYRIGELLADYGGVKAHRLER